MKNNYLIQKLLLLLTLFCSVYNNAQVITLGDNLGYTETTDLIINSGYSDGKAQYIYKKSEIEQGLVAEGLPIGSAWTISGIYLNVYYPNTSSDAKDFTIKIANTTSTQINPGGTNFSFINDSSFTTVYTASSENKFRTSGIKEFQFTTPFLWDGNSNIVIQLCYNNDSYYGVIGIGASGVLDAHTVVTTDKLSLHKYRSDSVISQGNVCTETSGGTNHTTRLNIGMKMSKPCNDNIFQNTSAAINPANGTSTSTSFTVRVPQWENYISGLTYKWYYRTSPTGSFTEINNGTTSVKTFTLGGSFSTAYLYCEATCTATGIKRTSNIITFNVQGQSYCIPSSTTTGYNGAPYISRIAFKGTRNDFTHNSGLSSTGYSDFTQVNKAVQVRGESINIDYRSNYITRVKAWVDWNKDGVFDESTEKVYDTGSVYGTSSTSFGFVIPINATPGDYRIRIRNGGTTGALIDNLIGILFGFDYNFNPCEEFADRRLLILGKVQYGEAEDYDFTVLPHCETSVTSTNNTGLNRCGEGTFNIVPSNVIATEATHLAFYTQEVGGTLVGEVAYGSTFTTPSLSQTTVYWVSSKNATCESPVRKQIILTVNSVPEVSFDDELLTICGEGSQIVDVGATISAEMVYLYTEEFADGTGFMESKDELSGLTGMNIPDPNKRFNIYNSSYTPTSSVYKGILSSGQSGDKFVVLNADYDRSTPVHSSLVTSSYYDVSNYESLYVNFKMYYHHSSAEGGVDSSNYTTKPEYLMISVSTNNGSSWTPVKFYSETTGVSNKFQDETIDLTPFVGNTQLKVKFTVYSDASGSLLNLFGRSWYTTVFAIDKINVYGTCVPSPAFIWDAMDGLYAEDCQTVLSAPSELVCFKPTNAQISGNSSWTLTANAIVSNGCVASGSKEIFNSSKVWDTTASTDWHTENWLPESDIPTIENCVIVKKDVVVSESEVAYAKNIHVLESGSIKIESEASLLVKENIRNDADPIDFLVESSANLIQIDTIPTTGQLANLGEITVDRIVNPMSRTSYSYVGSPVKTNLNSTNNGLKKISLFAEVDGNFVPEVLSGSNFRWDNTINGSSGNAYGWTFHSSEMQPMHGYIIKAPNSANFPTTGGVSRRVKFRYTGQPNNGNYTIMVKPSINETTPTLTLISNPYPSAVTLNKYLDNIEQGEIVGTLPYHPALYLWINMATPSLNGQTYSYNNSDYYIVNKIGHIRPDTEVGYDIEEICSTQGFFVIGSTTGGNFTISNASRYNAYTNIDLDEEVSYEPLPNKNIFRVSNQNQADVIDRFYLNFMDNQNFHKELLIGSIIGGTEYYDDYDAPYLSGDTNGFYTLTNNIKLAIQSIDSPLNLDYQIEVGFIVAASGNYTISLGENSGIFTSTPIYLWDTFTNQIVNLHTSDYTFSSTSGQENNRFKIVFQDVLSVDNPTSDALKWYVYTDEDYLLVKSVDFKIQAIHVYDLLGREVYKGENLEYKEVHKINKPMSDQLLIVKVKDQDGNWYSRKIKN